MKAPTASDSRAQLSRLDRNRLLWETVLLEGLTGGRWALASESHHRLVDGISSVDERFALMDGEQPHRAVSSKTMYAFGAPLQEVLPLVPLFAGHAVDIAVVCYDGEMVFGLNADPATVPDLAELAEGISGSLAEFEALGG